MTGRWPHLQRIFQPELNRVSCIACGLLLPLRAVKSWQESGMDKINPQERRRGDNCEKWASVHINWSL